MENVLQTLAGQYTQQLALMMAAVAVAAFTVSVITEVTKEIGFLGRIPTAVQVIVLSVVLCQLVYWWYVTSTKAAADLGGSPVLALVVAFYVAFLAMYGWEKLAQLWVRYKHPGGSA